jgi:hypothetical protein
MKLTEKEILETLPEEVFEISLSICNGLHGYYQIIDSDLKQINGVFYANSKEGIIIVYDHSLCENSYPPYDRMPIKLIQNLNFRILRNKQEVQFIPEKINKNFIGLYNNFLNVKKIIK